MTDAPPDLLATYEHRCRAIEALAAIDGPALSSVWRLGYEPLIEDLRRRDARGRCAHQLRRNLAGVEPKLLPRSRETQRQRVDKHMLRFLAGGVR